MNEFKKILFAGLDGVGKTSIIMAIQNKFAVLSTKPTLGVEYKDISQTKWLGINVTSWDLGGQSRFRQQHLQKAKLFDSVSTLFFIIDVQDVSRYDDALIYFEEIITKLKEVKSNCQIICCYNKFDPDHANRVQWEQNITALTPKIQRFLIGFPVLYQATSIYDPPTISRIFFEGVIKGTSKQKLITNILNEYAKITFSSAVVLMDDSCLVVGAVYSHPRYLEITESVTPWTVTAMDRIKKYNIEMNNIISELQFTIDPDRNKQDMGDKATLFVHRFQSAEKMHFILISLSRSQNTSKANEKHLPEFAKKLSALIHAMEQ